MPIFPGVSCAELEIIHSIRFDVDRSILALRDDQLNAIIEEGKMLLRRIDPVAVAIEGEVMGTVSVSQEVVQRGVEKCNILVIGLWYLED